MIDEKMVVEKIRRIQIELLNLERFEVFTFDEVAKNYDTHTIVERIIERIVGFAIDINQHILVEGGKGDLPFDFKKSFLFLVDLDVYPKEFAEQICESAGLRNILVHDYVKLDENKFYNSIRDCNHDYTKYCRYILDFLKKKSS
ncbi:MAG: DUF86 domain-containing protein [Candidatus Levyibacteriota bacterium]|nr:MAG: DUF86 domain-containing protein [Candidatus Levybacteria bacterium]